MNILITAIGNIFKFNKKTLFGFVLILIFVSSCSDKSNVIMGYVEGRFAYVSSVQSGILEKLLVKKGDIIESGQLLFVLDEEPEASSLKRALAEFESLKVRKQYAEKNVEFNGKILERRMKLMRQKSIDPESVDAASIKYQEAVQNLDSIKSDMLATQADISRLKWGKAQKSAYANVSGKVFDTFFLLSELVPSGQPVLSILPENEIYLVFFIDELHLSQMQVGKSIEFSCDGFNKSIPAKVSFVSPQVEFTPPALYTIKQREDLKYRVEAIPNSTDKNNSSSCLHPGQPVIINILKEKL